MLRRKLLLMCVSLVLFITIVNGRIVSGIIVRTIDEEVHASFEVTVDQQLDDLSDIVDRHRSDTLDLCGDPNVQNLLRSAETPIPQKESLALMSEVEYAARRLGYLDIELIAFTKEGSVQWDEETGLLERGSGLEEERWYTRALANPCVVTYTNGVYKGSKVIRAAKCVYDNTNWSRIIGMVVLDMDMSSYITALHRQDTPMYLLDEDGTLIYPFIDYYGFTELEDALERDTIMVREEQYLISHRSVPMSKWTLVGFISSGQLYAKGQQAIGRFWALAGVALLLAVAIAVYTSYSVTKALSRIIRKMELASSGELEPVEYPASYKGEIRVLYDSYNHMVEQTNDLMQEVYQARIDEKEAELRTLQAQINPHFIYNTLDTINWMAMRYRAKDIQQMIHSLASMLRCSLNNGENIIRMSGEYEQIINYVNIQKVRDPDGFDVVYDMDEAIMHYRVIKLILQPLVENAILHGCNGVDYRITIRIQGRLENGHIVLQVCNDGNRPDVKKIQQLLDMSSGEKPKGYGIRNVNMRLIKHYGNQYGIQYCYDEELRETQATIRIPVVDQERQEHAEQMLEELKRQIGV